jgi:hypothetical protein
MESKQSPESNQPESGDQTVDTMLKFLKSPRNTFLVGAVVGVLFTNAYNIPHNAEIEVCKATVKERNEFITKMIEENRIEAASREKSLAAQRDSFIEMVREMTQRMSRQTITPVIEYRYRTKPAESTKE